MLQTGFYYESEDDYYDEEEHFEETPQEQENNKLTDAEKKMKGSMKQIKQEDDYEDEEDYVSNIFDFAPAEMVSLKGKKFKNVNLQSEDEANEDIQEEIVEKRYARFRGADKIFHRILWDEKFDKNDFVIGYEDRFEGIIEEPFEVFELLKEDIPFHRIRFFKKKNETVWERKTKINKL